MFWDLVSGYYEVFENLYNGKVNRLMCKKVAERISSSDEVLECACGTGMISVHIAAACKHLMALMTSLTAEWPATLLCLQKSRSLSTLSSHYHIKYHHQDKTDGKADGTEIRVLTAGGFGNQFLDHDIEHGSGGKGKHVREDGHEQGGQQ